MSEIKSILENLGYRLKDHGKAWQANAAFRQGDNPQALLIDKDGSGFHDFVDPSNSGPFKKLIALTLGKSYKEAEKYLKNRKYEEVEIDDVEVDLSNTYPSVFDINYLGELVPDHSYWIRRGVPESLIKHFRGGVVKYPSKAAGRYVFPIFARNGSTINGFAGRKLKDSANGPKWLCLGRKSEWEYPLFLTEKHVRETETIVIAESIGDGLNLSKANVRNFVLPIGIASFQKLSLLCIEFNPKRIIIAFNNDLKSGAGNKAAAKLQKCLLNFFNKDRVKVCLPPEGYNDMGEICDSNIIKEWYENATK